MPTPRTANRVSTSSVYLEETGSLGTKEAPLVWYIKGNLTIDESTLRGYGVFIVEGNVTLSETNFSTSTETDVAIYAQGTVTLSQGSKLRGVIYAQSGVDFASTSTVHGSVATPGSTSTSSTLNIYYREAAPELTELFWSPAGTPVMVSGGGDD